MEGAKNYVASGRCGILCLLGMIVYGCREDNEQPHSGLTAELLVERARRAGSWGVYRVAKGPAGIVHGKMHHLKRSQHATPFQQRASAQADRFTTETSEPSDAPSRI